MNRREFLTNSAGVGIAIWAAGIVDHDGSKIHRPFERDTYEGAIFMYGAVRVSGPTMHTTSPEEFEKLLDLELAQLRKAFIDQYRQRLRSRNGMLPSDERDTPWELPLGLTPTKLTAGGRI